MNPIILDEAFSTTKRVMRLPSVIESKSEDGFNDVLFLVEGGLRTKGYFKQSEENKPLISIVTVVFNGEQFLEETILSVIEQSYDNVEYIVIDGGSTDGTLEIIKKYEGQIDYWVSEKDKGIYDAMNRGITLISGDWVNFMNAGDRFCDDVFKSIFTKKTINSYDLVYGDVLVASTNGDNAIILKPKNFTKFNLLFWSTRTLCHQAMFVNKKTIVPYSIKYTLKGELNWYFDLTKYVRKYLIVDIPIVYYSLGGIGDVNTQLNSIETFKVVFSRFGIFGLITIPVVLYKLLKKIFND